MFDTESGATPDVPGSSPSQGSERVRSFLSHAIDIDPDFAPAHANLAVYFFTLVPMGLLPPDEGIPAARAAAQRATHLDPTNADAHALRGTTAALYDNDWVEAERHFARALANRRITPATRFHYAVWYLSPLERHAEALTQLSQGLVDDPLYLLGRVHAGMELHSLGRGEEGLAELEDVLTIDPRFGPALGLLGREQAGRQRIDVALSLAHRAYAAIPRHPNAAGFLAGMLRRTGNRDRGREVLERLEREAPWSVARARAESHIACGEMDEAITWIERAVAARDPGVWLLFLGTAGRVLRSTPKWAELRRQLNLPTHRESERHDAPAVPFCS